MEIQLRATETAGRLADQVRSVFVGRNEIVDLLLIGFFTGLHVLIEDIPGVGKTTLARSLAAGAGLDYGRIQFTPDLLPGDITGMTVWSQEKREFVFKEGAVMHQFLLADEINRASARTQSALLEAMQEESVTVDGNTYRLPKPFFVIATQNPVTFGGTFLLPEAQVDRFGISFSLGYPRDRGRADHPRAVPGRRSPPHPRSRHQFRRDRLDPRTGAAHSCGRQDPTLSHRRSGAYPVASRYIRLGMSPRATQHLLLASQGRALLEGRDFVIPEDVLATAVYVLRHRLILSSEARMEHRTADQVISSVLEGIPLPAGI